MDTYVEIRRVHLIAPPEKIRHGKEKKEDKKIINKTGRKWESGFVAR